MSNVETRVDTKSAAPIGVRFFAGLAVEQINNPKRGGFIEQPLLLTSGQEPQKNIPTALGSEPKSPHPMPHTRLRGVRPLEDHDARLFHDVYRGPARLDDEFGRVPTNRTQRRAEARELQRTLQETGIPRVEARNQSRQVVGLNKPLEDRLKAKRAALFETHKQTATNASAPQVDTRTLDNNPDLPNTETTVKANELTAAFEDMVSTQVEPVVKEYFDTLHTTQEQATAAAFLGYIFSLGAANLTPDAQIEFIRDYQSRQAKIAKAQGTEGTHLPPATVAGLLLAAGLTAFLLAGCMPDDQSDATPVPPAVPTLIASELPTVAATFAASPTPDGSNNEAMTTPLYRPTVDAFRGQIPPDLLGSLDSYGVQDVVDQYALGNPTLATELTAESANLIHALLGDPESLVVLPDNIEPIGISHNNQYPDTFINGNHLGFKVVAGNEAPTDEYPEGTLFFWNDGQDVASATDPEIARSNVLIIKPPQGGTLERMEYANLYTIVGINAEGEIVFYLNESNERLDKDGKPIDAAATIEAEGAQITSTPVPADTPTPELTPTPEPSPTPELILEEGEVRYEFRTPDSSEIISFAIPEEWVNILSYTENESGQFYNDRPLAQAGIVEESGIRKFKVGNITVAEEIDGKWEKNETVYVMENYLDFEGRILAQDENLGRIDPNQISAPKVGVKFSVNSKNVPGIGAINYKVIHNPIIVGATRTNIVVIDQNNRPLETAQMQLDMAYWTQNGDSYSLSQFSVTGHDIIGVDDGPVLLSNFNPDLGETLTSLFLIWSNNLAPETDRQSAVAANSMWRMSGLGMLTETTEPSVSNGSTLELPYVFLASIEP